MDVTALQIQDVKLITPTVLSDDRGTFCETYQRQRYQDAGLHFDFCQDNHSYSRERHTLRGLHAQAPPYEQTKLVRVLRGAILDVAVDARVGSATFGQWVSAELSAENHKQILVPHGFLHGFLTLEPDTEVSYKVDNIYDRVSEIEILWSDMEIGVEWGLEGKTPILSAKDSAAQLWSAFDSPFKAAPS